MSAFRKSSAFRTNAGQISAPQPRRRSTPSSGTRPSYDPRYNFPTGTHTDLDGVNIAYAATPSGLDLGTVTRGGIPESFTYDTRGELTRHASPEGLVTDYTPSPLTGFVTTVTAASLVTTYNYQGGLIGIEAHLGWPVTTAVPGLPPSTTRYNETGAVIATLSGSQASYVGYGAHGRTSSTSMDLGNQRLYRESYRYEVDGFMRGRTITGIETGALATPADQPWSYTRGPRGSVREILAPDGQQTIHTLDNLGATTRTVRGDVTIDRTFDLNGNLFTQAVGTEVTTLRYDGHDRLETTLLATGRQLATEYQAGTLSRVRSTSIRGPSGPVEMETIFGNYDGVGRPRRVTSGADRLIVQHTSPGMLVQSATLDGVGLSSATEIDTAGRVVSATVLWGTEVLNQSMPFYGSSAVSSRVDITERNVDRTHHPARDPNGRVEEINDANHRRVVRTPLRSDGTPESITRGHVTVNTPHDRGGRSLGTVKISVATTARAGPPTTAPRRAAAARSGTTPRADSIESPSAPVTRKRSPRSPPRIDPRRSATRSAATRRPTQPSSSTTTRTGSSRRVRSFLRTRTRPPGRAARVASDHFSEPERGRDLHVGRRRPPAPAHLRERNLRDVLRGQVRRSMHAHRAAPRQPERLA